MVAPRQPPKLIRSPPPSSSSSPPPPSTSAAPPQPMAKLPRFRREGTAATTITTGNNNAPSVNSAAAPPPRPGPGRTIPTTAISRPLLRKRPSPSPPPPNARAATLEASNQAPAAPPGEPSSRSVFTLRREGLGVPQQQQQQQQQPQAAGAPVSRWKRRRPDVAAPTAAAAAASAAASRAPQEAPETKRQQVERTDKPEPGTGGAAPKSAPQASVAASVEASAPAIAVEEQRSGNATSAPVVDEGKAPGQPPSTGPAPVPQQQDKVSDLSDLTTRSDPVADPEVSKSAVASALAVSVVGGKPGAVEDPMDVVPVTEDGDNSNSGRGGDQVTEMDDDDAHDSSFVALIKKHAEMIRSSSLWISGSLQSIRDDISKAAASDAGRAKLGEMARMSITDFFQPAAERTKVTGDATDAFVEEVERYCKSDKEVAA